MKYSINNTQGDFEPSSEGRVLKNKLGIVLEQDMVDVEEELLLQLYERVFEHDDLPQASNFQTVQKWHRQWLGNVYDWAGELRTVNMSKGGFQFASALHLPRLVASFERDYLSKFGDLEGLTEAYLIQFLTESHVEFILIHPFREGNGRISRLLMDVMVTQAGFSPLDYSLMEQHKDYYFKSIQAGVAGDYLPLNRLMADVFQQSKL